MNWIRDSFMYVRMKAKPEAYGAPPPPLPPAEGPRARPLAIRPPARPGGRRARPAHHRCMMMEAALCCWWDRFASV